MKFEVINSFGKTVMCTDYEECVPNKKQIDIMRKVGYRIKIDNKITSKKTLDEFLTSIGRDK